MTLAVKPLPRLSPSQFGRLLGCPYRTLLERSPEGKTILVQPGKGSGGAGAVGNIVHKVLEAANRGAVQTAAEFENVWQQELAVQEALLLADERLHLVPLAYRVRGYAVTKLLVKWLLSEGSAWSLVAPEPGFPIGPEQTLTDRHGSVRGQADLVRRGTTGGLEILDYKTGRIFQVNAATSEAEIKKDFVWQLQLYAALLYEQTGHWPERLLVADLAGGEHQVSFTPMQCLELLTTARSLLAEINAAVARGEAEGLAKPSVEICGLCKVQQLCEPHAAWVIAGLGS